MAFTEESTRQSARSIFKGRVASAFCLIPALYCFGVVSFALINAHQYASETPQLMRYVVVPGLLLAVFTGCAIFASRVTRIGVGATAIAILLALFAFEVKLQSSAFSAVAGLIEMPADAQLAAEGAIEGLPPAATAKKLTQDLGISSLADAVVSGIPGQRVLLCGYRGQPVTYRADRYGFRNDDAAYEKPVGTMLLGDSFVEGICLPNGQDLVGQFRGQHSDTVGLGTRGAGPLQELAMLGRFGPAIRPKRVIIVFYEGNDWENLAQELRVPWLRAALEDEADFGPAILPQATIARALPIIHRWTASRQQGAMSVMWATHIPRNALALHQAWTQLGLGYPKAAPDIPEYTRVLAQSKVIAARWGGRVSVAYIPQTSRLIGLLPDQFVFDQVRDKVRAAAAANDIALLDLTPIFLRQEKPIGLYAEDGHLNTSGAALAARSLAVMTAATRLPRQPT